MKKKWYSYWTRESMYERFYLFFKKYLIMMKQLYTWCKEKIKIVKKNIKAKKQKEEDLYQYEMNLAAQLLQNNQKDDMHIQHIGVVDMWKFWLISLCVVLLWYFIYQWLNVLYLILAWFILSMALENLIVWLQKRYSRWFALFLSYFFFLIFILSWVIIVVPFVIQQIADIINLVLVEIADVQDVIQTQWLDAFIESLSLPLQVKDSIFNLLSQGQWKESVQQTLVDNISQIVTIWSGYITNAWSIAVNIVSNVFAALFQIAIVFIVAVFFSLEKQRVVHFIAHMSWRVGYTSLKLKRLYRKLGVRLKWQWLLCLIVWIAVRLWLVIVSRFSIDIPNKFTLALIWWLTEFIPYLGPLIGALPAILLWWLSYGRKWIVAMSFLYRLIQQAENNVFVPVIMSSTLWVSPLLIFLCMILWGSLLGLLWVILAVPFAVILDILFEWYAQVSKQK